ncbi:phage regulatory CII family protein [Variovorax sp. UMC13]|uniref:phage regulatory CII family protein n=1 Tax=Variovorax sp. UMC13 TaxID=1862326 RepID=UPI0016004B00|nr:phage regulatory CII family protein [Variovorax sp. UMC13]MBB1603329.1 hypothetical protein [Variovorax sp. UMC13]
MDDVTALLQDAVSKFRSTDPNGSNGAAGLSKLMGITAASLSHKVSPTYPTAHCSPREVLQICKLTGDMVPIQAMAAALGGVFVPLFCASEADANSVSCKVASAFKENGEWLAAAGSANAQAVLNANQLAVAKREMMESIMASVRAFAALEAKHSASQPEQGAQAPGLRVA